MTPASRIHLLANRPIAPGGRYVLYWMTMNRRLGKNFALQRAVEIARDIGRPVLVFEPLRVDYEGASDRLHAFVIQGMADHAARAGEKGVTCYPYVEPRPRASRGLLTALAAQAAAVVTDWYPAFFIPRMTHAAARQIDVRLEAVDSNGLLPVTVAGRAFPTAYSFRAYLQRTLREHLREWPKADPLAELPDAGPAEIPPEVLKRWPMASPDMLAGRQLGRLPIDHDVRETGFTGGGGAAHRRLADFIRDGLARYADEHNHPDANATSRLSPWLHFGHLGAHEVFEAVMKHEGWSMRKLPDRSRGAREGWWGVSATAEAFLDELVTWRELAFNTSAFLPGFTTVESLPSWARATLDAHRADPRPHLYDADTLDRAATHDRLWNAAQRQLVRDGWFHGYLRMLWGKKIFEWSPSPEAALATMERLMNRYSLDGRDPNSWAGFGWVLGRYDRPWPEREIFGKLRYMSSSNTLKKLRLKRFLSEYSTEPSAGPSPAARR